MKYEVVEIKELKVVGVSIITENKDGKAMRDLGELWGGFIGKGIYKGIENKTNGMAIGLYTDYVKDASSPYRFMCCAEVTKENNPELETRVIPAGKYAKFNVRGHMQEAVGRAWGEIWNMDLDRKYSYDFEMYHNDSEDMNNQSIDIYISIN